MEKRFDRLSCVSNAASNGCIVARSFKSVCPNHNRAKNGIAVKRKYDSFDNFPNVERFLANREREYNKTILRIKMNFSSRN